ncbi:MAG: sugar transferase [Anaerolineales bacterium]|nr:sugar transferase [Anaerolineales bacterium]
MKKSKRWRLRLGERRALLVTGDIIAGGVSLFVGLYYWQVAQEIENFVEFLKLRPPFWFFLLPLIWVILLNNTYDTHRASNWEKTIKGVFTAAVMGIGIYLVVYFSSDSGSLPRRGVASFIFSSTILTLFWRRFYINIFTDPQFMRRVLVVGAGITGNVLLEEISKLWPPPFFVVGMIDDAEQKINSAVSNYKILGTSKDLLQIIDEENVTDLVVAITGNMNSRMFRTLLEAQEMGVEITRFPTAFEQLTGRVPVQYLEADWILRSFVDENTTNSFYELFKRSIDILGGSLGVLILLLIGPVIAIITLLDSGWPVVFRQTRIGKGGKPYTIIKFRTMIPRDESDNINLTQESDDRVTKFGKFLRISRLDEWPQFINVLRGDMSIVGPRPEQPKIMEHYQNNIPFYRARLLDKPGITGWAQINYHYAGTIEETVVKLEYDLYYIKHRSVMLDILIILRTASTVLGLKGR